MAEAPQPAESNGRLLELLERELGHYRAERYRNESLVVLARELHRFGCTATITPIGYDEHDEPMFRLEFAPLE
jgi:hypothetical protein